MVRILATGTSAALSFSTISSRVKRYYKGFPVGASANQFMEHCVAVPELCER